MDRDHHRVCPATRTDASVVAGLLHAFNTEFDTPTPSPEVLAERLSGLLTGGNLVALLAGEPPVGLAVVSFRPSVWYDGPVATLDELYVAPELRGRRIGHALLSRVEELARERGAGSVEINVDGEDGDARRFYEAHGYTHTEPGAPEPMYFYYRDL